MTWGDIDDLLRMRSLRLGLPDDSLDLLMGAYSCLQKIVDQYDLPAYTVFNEAMFDTRQGERTYPLPDDFGRLLHVHDQIAVGVRGTGQSGLFIQASTTNQPQPLQLQHPILGRQQRSIVQGRPSRVMLSQRTIILDPEPNGEYRGIGVYALRVLRPDFPGMDEQVPLDEPMVIVSAALAEAAADRGLAQAGAMAIEARQQMSALVNNAHRLMAAFFTARWPLRSFR